MLKAITREQLLGNYGKLSSYVLLYVLCELVISSLITEIQGGFLIDLISGLAGSLLLSVFTVGFMRVCMQVARSSEFALKDFFYAFKHDPDKVIIISFVHWFFSTLMLLPIYIPKDAGESVGLGYGALMLVKCVLIAVFMVLYLFVYILLSQSYFIYLDRPELDAREILTLSVHVMSKNKFRYFYLMFNVFGMMCLTALTLGIAIFWMLPCMYGLMVNFYEDLRGALTVEEEC